MPKEIPAFYDPYRDGVTQGLLNNFATCRQKARWFLEGWTSRYFAHTTYGSVVHAVFDEVYNGVQNGTIKECPTRQQVSKILVKIEDAWKKENPRADARSIESMEMALLFSTEIIPPYFRFWESDISGVKWLGVEDTFKFPLKLANGRVVFVRGRRDGQYLTGKKGEDLYLFETKTKSRIVEGDIVDVIPLDLQVRLYCYSLLVEYGKFPKGCTYNIIRKPGLKLKKGESIQEFSRRCAQDIEERPDHYFMRFNVTFTQKEIREVEEHLRAMVTDFVNWWEGKSPHYHNSASCETKYGACDYLRLCSGAEEMYIKRKFVYRELEDL